MGVHTRRMTGQASRSAAYRAATAITSLRIMDISATGQGRRRCATQANRGSAERKNARPDCAARAALTASGGSDLPLRRRPARYGTG